MGKRRSYVCEWAGLQHSRKTISLSSLNDLMHRRRERLPPRPGGDAKVMVDGVGNEKADTAKGPRAREVGEKVGRR